MSLVDIGIYVGRSRILHGQVSDLSGDLNRESCVVWAKKGARQLFVPLVTILAHCFGPPLFVGLQHCRDPNHVAVPLFCMVG